MTHQRFDAFTVIGIAARTNNAKEAGPDGVIPRQWQKYFHDGVADKIQDKLDSNTYAVYTDYESDHNGDYTFIIGAKVKPGTTPPEDMTVVNVPGGHYAVLTTEKGPVQQVIPATWARVFQLEDSGELRRAYKTDFELYDQRSQDPNDAQVDLYLGVN